MPDEKGPYKVVSSLAYYPKNPIFSVAVEKRGSLRILIPDAGEAQTARHICNLMNKHHAEVRKNLAPGEEVDDDALEPTDGGGLDGDGLGHGRA